MITLYQKYISPLFHFLSQLFFGETVGCRFHPTCSEYYKTALKKHGLVKGNVLGIVRILRCNPLSKGGHDPVPAKIN